MSLANPGGAARPRVLFITRKWPPAVGGMETYSAELTCALRRFVDVEVLALPGAADGGAPAPPRLAAFLLRAAWRLARDGWRFDVVHFGDFGLFPLAAWHRLLSPHAARALTVHGLDLVYGRRAGFAPAVYRLFMRWAAARPGVVNRYIANSRNTAELCAELGFGPVVAVPLGVRLDALQAPQPAAERYLLFVGRIVRRKGLSWFVRAVLPRLPADVTLKVVGRVWDEDEAAAVRSDPRVSLLGFAPAPELAALKAQARAIVMPNVGSEGGADVEGFGLVALEAAASGAPLVASDIEGLSDAVLDGVTGFHAPPGDAEAWATRLSELLDWSEERRGDFARRCQEALEAHFSWERVARDTLAAYGAGTSPPVRRSLRRAQFTRRISPFL